MGAIVVFLRKRLCATRGWTPALLLVLAGIVSTGVAVSCNVRLSFASEVASVALICVIDKLCKSRGLLLRHDGERKQRRGQQVI